MPCLLGPLRLPYSRHVPERYRFAGHPARVGRVGVPRGWRGGGAGKRAREKCAAGVLRRRDRSTPPPPCWWRGRAWPARWSIRASACEAPWRPPPRTRAGAARSGTMQGRSLPRAVSGWDYVRHGTVETALREGHRQLDIPNASTVLPVRHQGAGVGDEETEQSRYWPRALCAHRQVCWRGTCCTPGTR